MIGGEKITLEPITPFGNGVQFFVSKPHIFFFQSLLLNIEKKYDTFPRKNYSLKSDKNKSFDFGFEKKFFCIKISRAHTLTFIT